MAPGDGRIVTQGTQHGGQTHRRGLGRGRRLGDVTLEQHLAPQGTRHHAQAAHPDIRPQQDMVGVVEIQRPAGTAAQPLTSVSAHPRLPQWQYRPPGCTMV